MVSALFLMPKISSFFSMLGSAMIISAVLRDKKNRKNPVKRILLGMSIIDVLVSSQWLFVNLFYPPWGGDMPWAIGTYQSCVVQGAICQFNSASGFYNTMLALCYLLMIVYEWDEARIAKIEPYLHFFPLAWGFSTMVTGLVLDLYHPAGIDCWIAECPQDAIELYPGAPDCSKLKSWDIAQITTFRLAMFHGPVMLYTVLITIIMAIIYRKVREIEKQSARTSFGSSFSSSQQRSDLFRAKNTKNVFWQGVFYAGGFFLTWVLIILIRLLQFQQITPPETLVAFAAFFIAFQGSINALTFFRPLFSSERKLHPQRWGISIVGTIVLDQFAFCCRDTIPLNARERTSRILSFERSRRNAPRWSSRFLSNINSTTLVPEQRSSTRTSSPIPASMDDDENINKSIEIIFEKDDDDSKNNETDSQKKRGSCSLDENEEVISHQSSTQNENSMYPEI